MTPVLVLLGIPYAVIVAASVTRAVAALLHHILKPRAGSPHAAGADPAPVPGNAFPRDSGAADPPPRPAPAPGCSLCGYYPAWRPDLRLWVHRYERCPAHQSRERQP